jgi:hypothetical protein
MNALIAEAVKVCVEKKIPFLVYAQYAYGNSGSQTLMDFKASNGFEHILLPRYYGKVSAKYRKTIGIEGLDPRVGTFEPSCNSVVVSQAALE